MQAQFGQVVIGAPGAGKTTYCRGVSEFLRTVGRKVAVVNLDPANEDVGCECAVDVRELCTVEEAMREHGLGPNGAMLHCMETVEANVEWLAARLAQLGDSYLLLDCPGQIELFTHHGSLRAVLQQLTLRTSLRLCSVSLVEAHHVADAGRYVALALVTLSMMLQLELPHVSVLSKVDLVEQFGELPRGLEYYAEARGLDELAGELRSTLPPRFAQLSEALAELVEEFGLVSFTALNVQDVANVAAVVRLADKANGYVYGSNEMTEMVERATSSFDVSDAYDMYRRNKM